MGHYCQQNLRVPYITQAPRFFCHPEQDTQTKLVLAVIQSLPHDFSLLVFTISFQVLNVFLQHSMQDLFK